MTQHPDWERSCLKWWNRILDGKKAHWCPDWDSLPIDETVEELMGCTCIIEPESEKP